MPLGDLGIYKLLTDSDRHFEPLLYQCEFALNFKLAKIKNFIPLRTSISGNIFNFWYLFSQENVENDDRDKRQFFFGGPMGAFPAVAAPLPVPAPIPVPAPVPVPPPVPAVPPPLLPVGPLVGPAPFPYAFPFARAVRYRKTFTQKYTLKKELQKLKNFYFSTSSRGSTPNYRAFL